MKVTVIPIVIGVPGTILQRIGKVSGRLGNKRTSGDHQNNRIIKIGQKTEKRRDLLSLKLLWETIS